MLQSHHLSPAQARKLVLLSQGFSRNGAFGRGKKGTLAAISHLGYIQIDTISVIERAHHHTLWSRVPFYRQRYLNELQEARQVFEYWSHAAAYMPIQHYRFSLPRKRAILNGEKHWYRVDERVLQQVLERIAAEGPMQSKDFDNAQKMKTGWGEFKIAKRALEQLFMRGELMIKRRVGFQKVYDLAERVLASDVDQTMPSEEEHLRHLIFSYLKSNGLGTPAQMGHLLKGIKPKLRDACLTLAENEELEILEVGGKNYFALPSFESVLAQRLSKTQIKILSPFDNLLIQRDRMRDLFDFDYQIECYVTASKRKYGYFVLPILWGHQFAGRMDAKIDRKTGEFKVLRLFVETVKVDEFLAAFYPALQSFCGFNGGETVVMGDVIH